MASFQYRGYDQTGGAVTGIVESESWNDALRLLQDKGYRIDDLDQVSESTHVENVRGEEVSSRLTRSDAQKLATQLSELTAGELPIGPGLRAFSEEFSPGVLSQNRLKQHLLNLADALDRGDSIEEALSKEGAPHDLMVALRTGILVGQPDRTLAQYVTYTKATEELWVRLALGLAFPLIMFCLSMALLIMILVVIVPQFREILDDFGIELPWLTRIVLDLSSLLLDYGLWLILVPFVLVLGWQQLKKAFPRKFSGMWRWVPVYGLIVRGIVMSRFCYALSFLTENQVELPIGLRLAGESCGDYQTNQQAEVWAREMEAGKSLEEASYGMHGFPLELLRICQWESQPEILAKSLNSLAEMYAARARNWTTLLIWLLEPLIVLTSGVLFISIVVAMFMPMVRLLNDLF